MTHEMACFSLETQWFKFIKIPLIFIYIGNSNKEKPLVHIYIPENAEQVLTVNRYSPFIATYAVGSYTVGWRLKIRDRSQIKIKTLETPWLL